jgi:hypothetical protein
MVLEQIEYFPGIGGLDVLHWQHRTGLVRRRYKTRTKAALARREYLKHGNRRPRRRGDATVVAARHRKPHTCFKVKKELIDKLFVGGYRSGQRHYRTTLRDAASEVGIKYWTAVGILRKYKAVDFRCREPTESHPNARHRSRKRVLNEHEEYLRDNL